MAAKGKAAKAAGAKVVSDVQPYVQRVIEDEDLRDNVRDAVENVRDVYDRLTNGKPPHKVILEDKKFQKSLQNAATSLKEAGEALQGNTKKKRRGFGRTLLIGVVAAGAALALSEGLRTKVLDALFGKEEEFEYTSTTAPPTPAPAPTT